MPQDDIQEVVMQRPGHFWQYQDGLDTVTIQDFIAFFKKTA